MCLDFGCPVQLRRWQCGRFETMRVSEARVRAVRRHRDIRIRGRVFVYIHKVCTCIQSMYLHAYIYVNSMYIYMYVLAIHTVVPFRMCIPQHTLLPSSCLTHAPLFMSFYVLLQRSGIVLSVMCVRRDQAIHHSTPLLHSPTHEATLSPIRVSNACILRRRKKRQRRR